VMARDTPDFDVAPVRQQSDPSLDEGLVSIRESDLHKGILSRNRQIPFGVPKITLNLLLGRLKRTEVLRIKACHRIRRIGFENIDFSRGSRPRRRENSISVIPVQLISRLMRFWTCTISL